MFEQYKGQVVTAVTLGGEIIGRLKDETNTHIVLSDPRMFVMGEQGTGFAMGVSLTSQQNPTVANINMQTVLTVLPCNKEVEEGWTSQTSGIVLS